MKKIKAWAVRFKFRPKWVSVHETRAKARDYANSWNRLWGDVDGVFIVPCTITLDTKKKAREKR